MHLHTSMGWGGMEQFWHKPFVLGLLCLNRSVDAEQHMGPAHQLQACAGHEMR